MKPIQTLLAAIICIAALFTGWKVLHKKETNSPQIITHRSDTVKIVIHDTTWYHLEGRPKAIDSIFVATPVATDTLAILKRYFEKFAYADTIKNADLLAIISDTLTRNQIITRQFNYKILRPQTLETITNTTNIVQGKKTALYVGVFACANCNLLAGIGPELLLTTKSNAYGLGYDVLSKSITAQVAWKIFK